MILVLKGSKLLVRQRMYNLMRVAVLLLPTPRYVCLLFLFSLSLHALS